MIEAEVSLLITWSNIDEPHIVKEECLIMVPCFLNHLKDFEMKKSFLMARLLAASYLAGNNSDNIVSR